MKNVKQVIVVRKDLKLRKGKLASLAAHAAMQFILDNNESDRPDELQVKLSQQELATPPDQFARLPAKLRDLCERSLRLQSRLIHLDRLLYAKPNSVQTPPMGLRSQMERLQQAFTSPSA